MKRANPGFISLIPLERESKYEADYVILPKTTRDWSSSRRKSAALCETRLAPRRRRRAAHKETFRRPLYVWILSLDPPQASKGLQKTFTIKSVTDYGAITRVKKKPPTSILNTKRETLN